jgi:hypothetical protein
MKLSIHIKTKNDYLRNWLADFCLDSSITENYDSLTIELSEDDIKSIKNPTEAKTDVSSLAKVTKQNGDKL